MSITSSRVVRKQNIDNRVRSSRHKTQLIQFGRIGADIESDLSIYNKLTNDQKAKWLASDALLSAFIVLAAKVKQ